MIRNKRRGTGVIVAGMAAVTLAVGAVAYQASANTSTSGDKAGLMAATTADSADAAARPRPGGGVPVVLTPPAGLRRVATFRVASGTQTYTCANGSFAGASVPEAQLVGPRGRIHHYGGPTWEHIDRSLVTATKTAESAVPGSIAQLLLTVNSHSGPTRGLLSRVQNIQRLNTTGGVAPTRACTDGEKASVRYGADYVFWAN